MYTVVYSTPTLTTTTIPLHYYTIHILYYTLTTTTIPLHYYTILYCTLTTTTIPLHYYRYVSAKAKGRAELDWSAIGLDIAETAGIDVSADVNRNIKDVKEGNMY